MRRAPAAIAGFGALLAPAVASACPYCATRSSGGIGQSIALGVFLLLPFVVAGVIISILRSERRAAREDEGVGVVARRREAE